MSVSETPDFSDTSANATQAAPILDTPLVLGTHELKGVPGQWTLFELATDPRVRSGEGSEEP